MRNAYPLIWCIPEGARAKLLGMVSGPDVIPSPRWVKWPDGTPLVIDKGIDYKPIVHTNQEKEHIQSHTDAINKILSQAPSRSRV